MMTVVDPATLDALKAALPPSPLFGDGDNVGWLLSPEPYTLSSQEFSQLNQIGQDLSDLAEALNQLYRMAHKQPHLAWVKTRLDTGKPTSLTQFSMMNRFKNQLPLVIRPDLLVTETGFQLCEIDAVPGGLGFTGALFAAYQQVGFSPVGESIPEAFLRLMQSATDVPNPTIAVVVSDEAGDYRKEWQWLVQTIQQHYPQIGVYHPKDLTLMHNRLGILDAQGIFTPVDVIYRFFELFDLPNIPQVELIQYAVKKGLVACTPPFKPYLEEKLVLGLLHMPVLEPEWRTLLGDATFNRLKALIPQTWLLDPTPIPPHAEVIPQIRLDGTWIRDFEGLKTLTQKQRRLVMKPSGFSPLAWGSRGVVIGHDTPQTEWQQALAHAMASFETTPHLLQTFAAPCKHPYRYFDAATGHIIETQGRTRLCPYYFVESGQARLVGTLATTCPINKKIIHGMKDGVMRPCTVLP